MSAGFFCDVWPAIPKKKNVSKLGGESRKMDFHMSWICHHRQLDSAIYTQTHGAQPAETQRYTTTTTTTTVDVTCPVAHNFPGSRRYDLRPATSRDPSAVNFYDRSLRHVPISGRNREWNLSSTGIYKRKKKRKKKEGRKKGTTSFIIITIMISV